MVWLQWTSEPMHVKDTNSNAPDCQCWPPKLHRHRRASEGSSMRVFLLVAGLLTLLTQPDGEKPGIALALNTFGTIQYSRFADAADAIFFSPNGSSKMPPRHEKKTVPVINGGIFSVSSVSTRFPPCFQPINADLLSGARRPILVPQNCDAF